MEKCEDQFYRPAENIQIGAIDHESTLWLQRELCRHKLLCEQDGIFGNETDSKLRTFQKNNGLRVTGKLDVGTIELLKCT